MAYNSETFREYHEECPWCNSTDEDGWIGLHGDAVHRWIACTSCGARGPWVLRSGRLSAVEAWEMWDNELLGRSLQNHAGEAED